MGQIESAPGTQAQPFSANMYLPMGGMRMNIEKEKDGSNQSQLSSRVGHRSHIVQTAFTGIWSMHMPTSGIVPQTRTGHFHCSNDDLNIAVTGFGMSLEGEYLLDIWILNISSLEWVQLNYSGVEITPRSGASAVIVNGSVILFGGSYQSTYMNDMYAIDVKTGVVQPFQTTGALPSPRSGAVIGFKDDFIYLWGGFDGSFPNELSALNLSTMNWESHPQDIAGRTALAYIQVRKYIFAYGSSKVGGLLVIDLDERVVTTVQTTGAEPPAGVINAGMVHFDKYLVLIGGQYQNEWTLIYACDLEKCWWFVFHILPDERTVSTVDGTITDLGLFMIPRIHSLGVVFSRARRQIIGFLGSPMKSPAPLLILEISEAMSILNLRTDMLERLPTHSGQVSNLAQQE